MAPDFIKTNNVCKYYKDVKGAKAVSVDLIEKLNVCIKDILDESYTRACENKRKTVMRRDI